MRARTPEADRLAAVLTQAGIAFRRLTNDEVAMDGVTPEQVGPLLASNQIVLYELIQEGGDLESVFLSLTAGLGFGDVAAQRVINALRAEMLKMRSMPGVWVTFAIAFPLTVLLILGVLRCRRWRPGPHLLLRLDTAPAARAPRRRLLRR